jgi:hypothetical protein
VGGNIEQVLAKLQVNVNKAIDLELAKYTLADVNRSVEKVSV